MASEDAGSSTATIELVPREGRFHGVVVCRGSTRIRGRVDGPIHAEGTLWIGPEATVRGAVEAGSLKLAGILEGPVTAAERVLLVEGATLRGTLRSPKVMIEAGAVIDGAQRVEIGPPDPDLDS